VKGRTLKRGYRKGSKTITCERGWTESGDGARGKKIEVRGGKKSCEHKEFSLIRDGD